MPAYNAEAFIAKNLQSFCIRSILQDIEILIINDGSTDNTLSIANEFVKKYPDCYRVITKENGGHGSGINVGIKHAQGFYFKVVDADDWVDPKTFYELIQILKGKKADVVYSGFLWSFEGKKGLGRRSHEKAEIKTPFKGVHYQRIYAFDDVADRLYMKMHNMTIRTSILKKNQIEVDEHCYYVDSEFITYPIPYVKTICFMKGYVYKYRIGDYGQSIDIKKMQQNEENYKRVIHSLLTFYSKLGEAIPCSGPKKIYIASIIARVIAGKVKVSLSFPKAAKKKQSLMVFDEYLRNAYPTIYSANPNIAVHLLRLSKYNLFSIASFFVRVVYF